MISVRSAVAEGAPDSRDALRRLERIASAWAEAGQPLAFERVAEGDALLLLRLACQRAPYLATLLARDPLRLTRVAADPYLRRQKPAWVMARELADRLAGPAALPDRELGARLRRYRADEIVRLGARELGLGSAAEVGAELAHLADVCLDAAIAHHRAALVARHGPPLIAPESGDGGGEAELVVIGMGKLGGEELNFASDIDVIYVYTTDAGQAGDLSLHEFFAKLCERVTTCMSEVTDEDTVFRVDLRLRPEGSRGAIANSLPSIERYYETWGRPWERQAWLKARPSAGSRLLGRQVLDTLAPFVYPRTTSPAVVADVRDLNRRIKAELDRSTVDNGFDVKNGAGGIREIEFFAQALQLIHAGQRPALRTRSTLGALDQLLFAGIISESERSQLADAYRALRRIEHLLQLDTGRQTQRMPTDPAAFELLARRLGHAGAGELIAELAEHTAAAARLFASLGAEEDGAPDSVIALLAGEHAPAEERRILVQLGLRDPDRAAQNLSQARRRASSPFGRAAEGAGARVAPLLLADVLASPDPDQALAHAAVLAQRRGTWTALWRMMDDSPHLRRLIASLFGTSEYLSKQFLDHPELLDALLAAGRAHPRSSYAELDELARARLAEIPPGADDERWSALAEMKNAQVLRIGLADIAGELRPEEVCRELSDLAEVCLARGLDMVRAAMRERHGQAREEATGAPAELAVLALGKLGGRELGYASDLDVVFVYSTDGDSDGERPLPNVTYMTRAAQRLMSGLHTRHPGGRLYAVDTRLRPSGSKGLLVSSLSAWQRYHREDARLWERQALTRLRLVAGDAELGMRACAIATECVYGAGPPGQGGRESAEAMAESMTAMRDRIERELAGEQSSVDVKAGRGGLIDIEFASQYLQLLLGRRHESLRTPSTVAALRAAAELAGRGAIPPVLAGPCALLADAYIYLRRIEHRIRIVHDASEQRLPTDPAELDKLARRLGVADGESLLDGYRRWTRDVRRAYDAILQSADLRTCE